MDAFLTAFWPNLAATLVGVALGLPIAMWVNRLALRGAERTAQKSQAQRVDHALQVLISAMQANAVLLREYAELLAAGKVKWRLALDVSAWEAIKGDFIAELTDPALRQEVAFHFSQLTVLGALNQEYLGFGFGTNASMSGADATRTSIGQNLKTMCNELSARADALVTASKAAQQSLSNRPRDA
jgi:hypothetical protein